MKPFITVFVIALSLQLSAQDFKGLDKSPLDIAAFPDSYRVSEKALRVVYSRPQLKGRDLNSLAPQGKVWRTGANETTEITFFESLKFGSTNIAPGTYALFTIPGTDRWTIIINKAQNTWGAYSYDETLDVGRIEVPVTEATDTVEALSMIFKEEGASIVLHIGWGNTRIAVPFSR
jgi:hypothetical protein